MWTEKYVKYYARLAQHLIPTEYDDAVQEMRLEAFLATKAYDSKHGVSEVSFIKKRLYWKCLYLARKNNIKYKAEQVYIDFINDNIKPDMPNEQLWCLPLDLEKEVTDHIQRRILKLLCQAYKENNLDILTNLDGVINNMAKDYNFVSRTVVNRLLEVKQTIKDLLSE